MRFAVDAHAIGRHLTGNEVYVRSLLGAFADLDRESEFIACVSEASAEASIPARFRLHRVSANPYLRLGWDLSRVVRREKVDLIHVQYTAPLFCSVPNVVTVHDVSFIEHPEFFTPMRSAQLRMTVARSVRMAAKVITVSEFSRGQILGAYDIPADKVVAIPNAANPLFRVIGRERAQKAVRTKLNISAPFVLTVGDLQPRKNHIGLIEAFSMAMARQPKLPHHLVLAGKETWFTPRVREAAQRSGIADRIHFLGFVDDSLLLELYNACDCFVFPSFYEGFGLPILEAMACGRTVACSNTSAMPEVADGAGLTFNPHSREDIARAITDILLDGELRTRMERLGLQRAAGFTWQKSGRATLEVYREVATDHRPLEARAAAAAQSKS